MSPEILSSGMPQYAAAYAIGHVAGALADRHAVHRATQRAEQTLSASTINPAELKAPKALLKIAPELASQTESKSRLGAWAGNIMSRDVLSPIGISLGVAGAAAAYVLLPGAALENTPPKFNIIIDHSADTAFGASPAVDRIDSLVKKFDSPKIDAEAIVVGSGSFNPIELSNVAEDEPFGNAVMADATNFALKGKNKAVIVLTNGNNIGDVKKVTASAKKAKTPVYVVNVESSTKTSVATTKNLKEIAKATGGKYWDSKVSNANTIAQNVTDTFVPKETRRQQKTGQDLMSLIGIVSAIGGVGTYFKRRDLTFGKRLKG